MREPIRCTEKQCWQFHVLGSRGSRPVCGPEYAEFGGATSCYVLKNGDYAVILDCGTGLYRAKELLRSCKQVDVLLSHVHYDHLLGLLDWSVFPKNARLRFLAPFDNWLGQDTLRRFFTHPFWPYTPEIEELDCVDIGEAVELGYGLSVQNQPSNHPDGGRILRLENSDMALCYACDYEHSSPFPDELARGCGLLIYDATFTPEEYLQYMGWGHSTWWDGCKLAQRLGIPKLLLVHHDPERTDAALRDLEAQARSVLPTARFARDGDSLEFSDFMPKAGSDTIQKCDAKIFAESSEVCI